MISTGQGTKTETLNQSTDSHKLFEDQKDLIMRETIKNLESRKNLLASMNDSVKEIDFDFDEIEKDICSPNYLSGHSQSSNHLE